MRDLIPVTLFSLLFAALSHYSSEYDYINGRYLRKERFFYALTTITLILFAGLRTDYNDTWLYKHIFQQTPTDVDLYEGIDFWKFGENPGFAFVVRLLKRNGVSTQSFLMIFSIFTIGTYLWFFRKYSCNMLLTILLFITFAGYTFSLAAIKQTTAMAFCLIATDRAMRKKYLQFLVFVYLGCLFHAYSFLYLVVPFFCFRPWGKYTVVMLLISAVVGVGLQSLLGTLLNVTDMLGEGYDAASFTGEGVNPVRLLVTVVPVGLSFLAAEQIAQKEERDQYTIVNLAMLNAEIMFIGLFGTANYFARLANYFLPFQAVSIPWLINKLDAKTRKMVSVAAPVGYLLFFIYSFAINENFDAAFTSTTLWKYLKSLF